MDSWPRLSGDQLDDPKVIGAWFDATVAHLDAAQADTARLRAAGRDAAANMLTARTIGQMRLFVDDARMLARHLWRIAHRTRRTSTGP